MGKTYELSNINQAQAVLCHKRDPVDVEPIGEIHEIYNVFQGLNLLGEICESGKVDCDLLFEIDAIERDATTNLTTRITITGYSSPLDEQIKAARKICDNQPQPKLTKKNDEQRSREERDI